MMKTQHAVFRLLLLGFALHVFVPPLCHAWSGRIVGVAYGDTLTGKNVKTFTSSDLEHETYLDPPPYVLEKLKSSDIVFLGMTHKRPVLLEFVRDLVPHLHEMGVTHLGLEIPSDQQRSIDRFLNTGESLDKIALHTQIECVNTGTF
jgi:hypothetical protein